MSKMIRYLLVGFFLPILLLVVSPVKTAEAQWSAGGNNVYLNNSNNNVGVGTQIPLAKFDVFATVTPTSRITWSDPASYGRLTFGQASTVIGSLQALGTNYPDSSRRGNIDLSNWYEGGDLTFWTKIAGFVSEKMRISGEGFVGIGTSTPGARLEVADGVIKSPGNAGFVETQHLTVANAWYTQSVNFPYPFGSTPRIVLTQDNSGTGDISIISFRVRKNTATQSGFVIDYYVNAIPTAGTTKFNWVAIET